MASELSNYYDEYERLVNNLSNNLKIIKDIHNDVAQLEEINKLIKQSDKIVIDLKEQKRSYSFELRLTKDYDKRTEYEKKGKELDNISKDLASELSNINLNIHKNELMSMNNSNAKDLYSTKGKDNDELLAEANVLQDQTFESLTRSRNLIEDSKVIGSNTLEELRMQRDQIQDVIYI
jgi:hypothetical protein